MSGATKIAVILLNYRNSHDTVECLESLCYSSYPAFGVIVVDCASGDDSIDRISSWVAGRKAVRYSTPAWDGLQDDEPAHRPRDLRAIHSNEVGEVEDLPLFDDRLLMIQRARNEGFAAGCNLALRAALRDPSVGFFWLLNNDTIVGADTLDRLVAGAGDQAPGAIGCVIASYEEPAMVESLGGGRVRRFSAETIFSGFGISLAALPQVAPALDYVSGTSCFVPRSTVEQVGLLDESMFLYWEDTDWSARMRHSGLRLVCALDAIVWHKGHSSTGGVNALTRFHHFRSATVYMRRHRRFWLFPVLYRLAKNILRDLAHGNMGDVAAATRGFFAGLGLPRDIRGAGIEAP